MINHVARGFMPRFIRAARGLLSGHSITKPLYSGSQVARGFMPRSVRIRTALTSQLNTTNPRCGPKNPTLHNSITPILHNSKTPTSFAQKANPSKRTARSGAILRNSSFIILLALAFGLLPSTLQAGFLEDFEESGSDYQHGHSIDLYNGWSITSGGEARVDDTQSAFGLQSLKLFPQTPETEVERIVQSGEWGSDTVAFWDIHILPVADSSSQPANVLDIDRALITFVEDSGQGRVHVYDADGQGGGQGFDSGHTFAIDGDNRATAWIRLTFRHDYAAGTWDLAINDNLLLVDLGLDQAAGLPGAVWFYGDSDEPVHIDDLELSFDNPLYTDTSRDNLPDDWLQAHGLDHTINQRDADPDGDGLSNIEEYLQGKLPTVADHDGGLTDFYYANNATGDNLFDGLAAVPMGGGVGPKETLSAAIATASTGDTILFLEGVATYTETTLDPDGKTLRLRPVGNVSIK